MINRIHTLRRQRKLTLQQVADAVGSTASTIAKIEKGQMRLTVDWMEKLAEILQVEPFDLVEKARDISGLSENAEPYIPAPGGPLQPNDHYDYVRMTSDDMEEHPDGIPKGSIICFDLNKIDRRAIVPGQVVLVSMFDKRELTKQHGRLVGQYIPPNKLCSNRSSNNWMINIDDDVLPYDPVIRGVMMFAIREPQN